ncbi:hypothetical protein L9F63_019798, partial [Diploptera punctata]
ERVGVEGHKNRWSCNRGQSFRLKEALRKSSLMIGQYKLFMIAADYFLKQKGEIQYLKKQISLYKNLDT